MQGLQKIPDSLPEGLNIDKAKAHFENGVLEIKIPKAPEAERLSKPISIE